ncbi:hypothetical protein FA15DRAFT_690843 [Coprinopsis marcescibilis]|uniref:Uncharacterized protein n=1 Tax=Coprinopsis marcescibilis TaxID=230819 RepID=A0A5C3LC90_COPMA|nr:hypothetical protein FA15DRAFT_690843 [Coprinopsis marcescibilis]
MSRPRLTYYDDTDISAGLNYSAGWFESFDSFSEDKGLVWKGTQHGTRASQASLSFSFIGASVSLTGRIQGINGTDNKLLTPTWRCFVDGEPVEDAMQNLPNRTTQINNYGLCSKSDLSAGRHTFSVEVEASQELPFYADRISVRPIVERPPENPTVQLQPLDEDFLYLSGTWSGPTGGDYRFTTHPGASVILDFHGTKVIWVSEALRDQPAGRSTGVYTLDDREPVVFNISGIGRGDDPVGSRVLFETDSFPAGKHRLNVTFLGYSAPLVLDRLVVEGGDILALGGTSLDSPFAKTINPPPPSKAGAIAGGVVGAVVGLALLLGLGWFLYNKKTRKAKVVDDGAAVVEGFKPDLLVATTYDIGRSGTLQPLRYGSTLRSSNSFTGSLDRTLSPQSSQSVRSGALREQPTFFYKGTEFQPPSTAFSSSTGQSGADSEKASLSQSHSALDRSASRVQLLQHDDSGIRLHNDREPAGDIVEELPPSYTVA